MLMTLFALLLSVSGTLFLSLPARAQALMEMREAFGHGEFNEVLRLYSKLSTQEQGRALPQYWVGCAYLRHHDFLHAEPYFKNASTLNLPPKIQDLCNDSLQRIQTLKSLVPPFMMTQKSGGMVINIYAAKDEWSKTVCSQVPVFLARANEAYPGESATVNFYLFQNRDNYDRFFKSWTHKESLESDTKHRGTGGYEMVEFCEVFPNGTKVGATNINDLYSRVCHEYSHALCATIYGDQLGFKIPQWLNESMADYFGWKFRPEMIPRQAPLLASLAKKFPPPTYEDQSRALYSGNFGYTFADNLLLELIKGKPLTVYRQILMSSKAHNGDFEAGLLEATGKDPKQVCQAVIARAWTPASSNATVKQVSSPAKAN